MKLRATSALMAHLEYNGYTKDVAIEYGYLDGHGIIQQKLIDLWELRTLYGCVETRLLAEGFAEPIASTIDDRIAADWSLPPKLCEDEGCPQSPKPHVCVEPSNTTQQLIDMLLSRDTTGRAKYGTSLDRTDLSADEWAQHMLEELLDAAGYLVRLRETMRARV